MSVPWNFSAPQPGSRNRFAIPVLIRIEPQRLESDASQTTHLAAWAERLDRLVSYGVRATLKSGKLTSPGLYLSILIFIKMQSRLNRPALLEGASVSTISAGFAQIEQKVSNLLDKLNSLKIEPVVASLDQNLSQHSTDHGKGQ